MTYNVFGGTLNLAQFNSSLRNSLAGVCVRVATGKMRMCGSADVQICREENCLNLTLNHSSVQEGLAVASIARDVVAMTTPRDHNCALKLDRNLKRKLAIMRQCTSIRQTDTDIVA